MNDQNPGTDDKGLRDERCECGNLLCKISAEAIEIKCRRCKRIHIIPLERLVRLPPKRE
jgi:hypothetical protein